MHSIPQNTKHSTHSGLYLDLLTRAHEVLFFKMCRSRAMECQKEKHCVSWSTIRLLKYTPFTVTPEDPWFGFASYIGAIGNHGGLTWRLPIWELAVSWAPAIAFGCNVQRRELSIQFCSRCISLLLSPAGLCMPF